MSKVVYRKNGGRRRAGYPLLVLCAVLLFGFSLVNIVWPKRTQLELENRKAAQLPAFSVSALLDGSWQSGFARWMQGGVAACKSMSVLVREISGFCVFVVIGQVTASSVLWGDTTVTLPEEGTIVFAGDPGARFHLRFQG